MGPINLATSILILVVVTGTTWAVWTLVTLKRRLTITPNSERRYDGFYDEGEDEDE